MSCVFLCGAHHDVHQVDLTTIPSHSFYAPKNVLVQAFRQSAVDMTLLSMADIHIISAHSGYGQKAAFIAGSRHILGVPRSTICSVENAKDIASAARQWSGI